MTDHIGVKVIDETGCIGAGQLLFSDKAWKDLLGGDVEKMAVSGSELKIVSRLLII